MEPSDGSPREPSLALSPSQLRTLLIKRETWPSCGLWVGQTFSLVTLKISTGPRCLCPFPLPVGDLLFLGGSIHSHLWPRGASPCSGLSQSQLLPRALCCPAAGLPRLEGALGDHKPTSFISRHPEQELTMGGWERVPGSGETGGVLKKLLLHSVEKHCPGAPHSHECCLSRWDRC